MRWARRVDYADQAVGRGDRRPAQGVRRRPRTAGDDRRAGPGAGGHERGHHPGRGRHDHQGPRRPDRRSRRARARRQPASGLDEHRGRSRPATASGNLLADARDQGRRPGQEGSKKHHKHKQGHDPRDPRSPRGARSAARQGSRRDGARTRPRRPRRPAAGGRSSSGAGSADRRKRRWDAGRERRGRGMASVIGSVILRTQSDERLVALARTGHQRAFEAIAERYRGELTRSLRRLLPPAVGRGRPPADPPPGVEGPVRRDRGPRAPGLAAPDRPQRGDRRRLARATTTTSSRTPCSSPPGPEHDLERREAVRRALRGIAELPERQREALLAVAVGGRSHAEVALELGITDTAARQLVRRARVSLLALASIATPPQLVRWAAQGRSLGPGREGGGRDRARRGLAGSALKLGAVAVTVGGVAAGVAPLRHALVPPASAPIASPTTATTTRARRLAGRPGRRGQAARPRPPRARGDAPSRPPRRRRSPRCCTAMPTGCARTRSERRCTAPTASADPGGRGAEPRRAPAPSVAPAATTTPSDDPPGGARRLVVRPPDPDAGEHDRPARDPGRPDGAVLAHADRARRRRGVRVGRRGPERRGGPDRHERGSAGQRRLRVTQAVFWERSRAEHRAALWEVTPAGSAGPLNS